MPRPKQRTQDLRDRVLEVAVTLLAEEGVAGFTTREVARQAQTSTPAVYELFGDKAGLVREVFFEGFRLLGRALGEQAETSDPRADVAAVAGVFRKFSLGHPVLAEVMFSRPFADFARDRRSRPPGRRCGSSAWPGCGAAWTRGCWRATRPTSRTCWSRSPRAWPGRRRRAGWAGRPRRWTGGGSWLSVRCSTG